MKHLGSNKSLLKTLAVFLLTLALIGQPGQPVKGEENSQTGLSLNTAISLALEKSESIRDAEKEVDKQKEWRDYYGKQLDFVPLEYPDTALVEVPYGQILTSDLEWRMSKKTLTAAQDTVVMETCYRYWQVLKARQKVETAQRSLDDARKQQQNSQLGYQTGTTSNLVNIGAQAQLEAATVSLQAAQNDLKNAWLAFNQLTGFNSDEALQLTDNLIYSPLEIPDLNVEISQILESAPTVWQAEEMITMQEYLQHMTLYTGSYEPYEVRKIEVEQAALDATTLKKTYKTAIRDLYYGLKNLEEAYTASQEKIKVAEENLRVKKLMYETGMGTQADVNTAEKDLADARYSALEIACKHAYMKLAFEKPWAANEDHLQE